MSWLQCGHCRKAFERKAERGREPRYCSVKCRVRAHRGFVAQQVRATPEADPRKVAGSNPAEPNITREGLLEVHDYDLEELEGPPAKKPKTLADLLASGDIKKGVP